MTKFNEHMHMSMITVNKYIHKNMNKHLLKTLGVGIMFKSLTTPNREIPAELPAPAHPQWRYIPQRV